MIHRFSPGLKQKTVCGARREPKRREIESSLWSFLPLFQNSVYYRGSGCPSLPPPTPLVPSIHSRGRQSPFLAAAGKGGKGRRSSAGRRQALYGGPRQCPGSAAPRPSARRAAGRRRRAGTAHTNAARHGGATGTSYLLPLYIAKGRGAPLGVPEEIFLQRNKHSARPLAGWRESPARQGAAQAGKI